MWHNHCIIPANRAWPFTQFQLVKKSSQRRTSVDWSRADIGPYWLIQVWVSVWFPPNLMAVFSMASGPSTEGRSSARISSGLRGSIRIPRLSLSLIPMPAVTAFHKAFWDLEPDATIRDQKLKGVQWQNARPGQREIEIERQRKRNNSCQFPVLQRCSQWVKLQAG